MSYTPDIYFHSNGVTMHLPVATFSSASSETYRSGTRIYINTLIPQGVLDPDILSEFTPLIMNEIATKELNHQDDARTRRDTGQYGFSFFNMLNNDFSYIAPPKFLQDLGAHICKAFGHDAPEFTNIILSVYKPGFRLEPHVDVNSKDLYGNAPFYFGERVYGIVIKPDTKGHLYFAKWEGEDLVPPLNLEPIYTVDEKAGSIFCLEGEMRQTPYFHAVTEVEESRISITFRTVERI